MSFLQALTRPVLAGERQESDPDLVAIVEQKLTNAQVSFAPGWRQEAEIKEAEGQNPELQRFLIGRNLTFKCHLIPENTEAARICLNTKGSIDEFLENLDKYVVPVLKSGIPQIQ